jgi:hypothetical protein
LFWDAPPVKEFRKKYSLAKMGSRKHLLHALLKSYKQFGGTTKKPTSRSSSFARSFPRTKRV